MLASALSPRSPLIHILTPGFLTPTLIPPGSNKSPVPPRPPPQDPSPPPSPATAKDGPSRRALVIIAILSGTLGGWACIASQTLVANLVLLAVFGREGASDWGEEIVRVNISDLTQEHLDRRVAMARDPRYTVFLALATPVLALPEELVKYLPVLWLRWRRWRRGQQDQGKKRLLDKAAAVRAVAAAGIGFAFAEGVMYVGGLWYLALVEELPEGDVRQVVAWNLLYRIFIGLPLHTALGMLSAARSADADVASASASGWRGTLGAMAPSIAYHAFYNFIAFSLGVFWGGHVGLGQPKMPWEAGVWQIEAHSCVLLVMYAHTARAWLGWRWESKRKRVGA